MFIIFLFLNDNKRSNSPEHGPLSQFLDAVSLPLQGFPPFRCLCFTLLVLLWKPSPQEVLHSVHGPNLSHSQSTKNCEEKMPLLDCLSNSI